MSPESDLSGLSNSSDHSDHHVGRLFNTGGQLLGGSADCWLALFVVWMEESSIQTSRGRPPDYRAQRLARNPPPRTANPTSVSSKTVVPDPVGGSPVFGSAPGVAVDVAAGLVATGVAEGVAAAVLGAVVAVAEGSAVAVAVVPAAVVPDGVGVWAKAGTSRNRNIATAAKPRAAVIPNVLFIGFDSLLLSRTVVLRSSWSNCTGQLSASSQTSLRIRTSRARVSTNGHGSQSYP